MKMCWRRLTGALLACFVAAGTLGGCAAGNAAENEGGVGEDEIVRVAGQGADEGWLTLKCGTEPKETLGGFEKVQLSWRTEDVEVLSLPESKLLNEELNLRVLKVEDGIYYTLGHGRRCDGTAELSMAVFGYDGTLQEAIGPEGDIVSDIQAPVENNVYHYFRELDGETQFVRADFNDFSQEVLASWGEDEHVVPWSPYFAYDGRQLCFIKSVKGENGWEKGVYRLPFDWQEYPLASDTDWNDVLEISMSEGGDVYIVMEDKFIMLGDLDRQDVALDFPPLSSEGMLIYYTDGEGYFCEYDTSRLVNSQRVIRQIARVNAECFERGNYDSDFVRNGFCYYLDRWGQLVALDVKKAEPYLLANTEGSFHGATWIGSYAAMRMSGDNRIVLWDTEAKDLAFLQDSGEDTSMWVRDDRYLFCEMETKLWILDVETQRFYEIELSEEVGRFNYFDGEYLYGRWDGDWDAEEGDVDTYFRVKVKEGK